VTHLQRISGDESDVDDVRPVEQHGVNESVLPLQTVLTHRRVSAVQMKPELQRQSRQTTCTEEEDFA